MKLFATLCEAKLYPEYASALDWLFSEEKFDKKKWDNANKVRAFTKAFHRLDRFSTSRLFYGPKKDIEFPEKGSFKLQEYPVIYMSKGSSEARDLLRHIRNGIAHGRSTVHYLKGEYVIEILDYGKEDGPKGGQTAYMLFPLSYVIEIYNLYCKKEYQWEKAKKSKVIKKERKLSKTVKLRFVGMI